MALNKFSWRNKYTSMKAAKNSTTRSFFKTHKTVAPEVNTPDKDKKPTNITSNANIENKPAQPPTAFKNRLLNVYKKSRND